MTTTSNQSWFTEDSVPDPNPLPKPFLWRILVRPLGPAKKVGNILLADSTIDKMNAASTVGRILSIGELAFTRPDMVDLTYLPQKGDYITFGMWAGFKFEYDGVRLITINDDEIVNIVPDPNKIKR